MIKLKVALCVAAALMAVSPASAERFGLIGHVTAKPGMRDAMIEALSPLIGAKGCLNFVIAKDPKTEDGIWLSQVWESKEIHDQIYEDDLFKAVMDKTRPLMVGFDQNNVTVPVVGTGIK